MASSMKGKKTAWLLSAFLIAVMLVPIMPYRVARVADLNGDLVSKIWSITDPSLTSDAWTQELKGVFAEKTGITSSTATSGVKWFPRGSMEDVSEPWTGQPLFADNANIPTSLPSSHTAGQQEIVAVSVNNGNNTTTTTYTSYTTANVATVELYTVRTTNDGPNAHKATDEYHVYTGEALRWVMNRFNNNRYGKLYLERNIDLNGQYAEWGAARVIYGQVVDGKGHTIYNLRATTIENARVGFISTADRGITVRGLHFQTGYLCNNSEEDSRTGIIGLLNGATFEVSDISVDNFTVVTNQSNTAVLIGRSNQGSPGAARNVTRCFVTDSVTFGTDHIASLTGCLFKVNYENCFSTGCTVISTGTHSGGLISCGNAINCNNCFTDVALYGSTNTGVFIGLASGDTQGAQNSFTNCYATGFIEGTSRIGGFIGTVTDISAEVDFKDCYTTALVGMRNGGTELGGFAGRLRNGGNPAITMTNCYAAGEVGSVDFDLSGDPVVGTQVQQSGGFIGNCNLERTTRLTFSDCYYDKQTTAMREWAIGVKPRIGTMNGMPVGVLTTDTVKSGNGITSSTSTASTGFQPFPGTAWDYSESEHYPELAVFLNATATAWGNADRAALVKAYSLASTSGVKLDTWDYGLNTATGEMYGSALPETTYCTVRDLTSGFVLTSKGGRACKQWMDSHQNPGRRWELRR